MRKRRTSRVGRWTKDGARAQRWLEPLVGLGNRSYLAFLDLGHLARHYTRSKHVGLGGDGEVCGRCMRNVALALRLWRKGIAILRSWPIFPR